MLEVKGICAGLYEKVGVCSLYCTVDKCMDLPDSVTHPSMKMLIGILGMPHEELPCVPSDPGSV